MGDVVQLPVRQPPREPEKESGPPPPRAPARVPGATPASVEPLWRESVGHELREERLAAGQRLVDVAKAAGVSPQYLSEIERGLKDPSSELLAAISGALGLSVAEIATRVGSGTGRTGRSPHSPVCLAA